MRAAECLLALGRASAKAGQLEPGEERAALTGALILLEALGWRPTPSEGN
jgi:hypothetical protein